MMKKTYLKNISILISIILLITACGNESQIKKLSKNSYNLISSKLYINEILTANANTNYDPDFKEFSDWIEIYNNSNESKDISGYYLSDSKKNIQKWQFPQNTIIKPYSYLLVWADGKDTKQKALHTNFKLSQDGERVIFSDNKSNIISYIKYEKMESDISFCQIDGEIAYMNPTPNRSNSSYYPSPDRSKKPIFSLKSGFYKGEQIIELQANGDIYYTLDGSHPTASSTPYNSPIIIDKTTVIRAISIEDGKFASLPLSQTYLIDENITLPVMSISIDEKYLNDDEIGIYKNFNEDWERAGNVEFIKDGESKFSQGVGIRIHGASSRAYPQKSFSISAKLKYENKNIEYPLFIDKPKIEKIKSFILRNSGSDWKHSMIRDALSHKLAKEIKDIAYQSYEPVVVFLNGNYYGLLNIREKTDAHYIKSNYNIDIDNIDFLKKQEAYVLKGNNTDYYQLINYIKSHQSLEELYNYISTKIDTKKFMKYNILEQYIGNVDWPQNNMKFWKEKKYNSKWQWILYDTDMSFSLKMDNVPLTADVYNNQLLRLYDDVLDTNSEVIIYRELLKNSNYRERYKHTFQKLLNTTFKPSNINKKIKLLSDKIAPEIPRHLKRWFGNERSYEDWKDDIQKLYDYSNERNEIVREQLEEF